MAQLAVIGCSQLLTLAGPARPRIRAEIRELSIVPDGAMFIADGRIQRTGARSEIEPLIDDACDVVDAGGRVVMPGFVDAHTHIVFAGTRADEYEQRANGVSYQQIAAAGGGIRATVRHTRAAQETELLEAAQRYAKWFLRTGTTTIEAKSGYGLTVSDELKILRVIRKLNEVTPLRFIPTFLGAHEVPDEYRGRGQEYLDLVIREMLPQVAAQKLAKYCDVFCEQSVFSPEEARTLLTAARSLGLGLRIHADQLTRTGAAELAAELRAATADHLEHTDDEGIRALRDAGVQPVLLPGSVYALGSRQYPAARTMIDAGLGVVLATDFNPGSSPTPSMPMILSLASTHMKLSPAEAITAATINAAYSLGRGADLGSLEARKYADFVIHDCADYREIPYFFGVEHAHAVFIGGQAAYRR